MVGEDRRVPEPARECVLACHGEIEYGGNVELESRQDAVTGEFRPSDVNPRTWSLASITPAGGSSVPMTACMDLVALPGITRVTNRWDHDLADGSVRSTIRFVRSVACRVAKHALRHSRPASPETD